MVKAKAKAAEPAEVKRAHTAEEVALLALYKQLGVSSAAAGPKAAKASVAAPAVLSESEAARKLAATRAAGGISSAVCH
jgi:hypothetical protein